MPVSYAILSDPTLVYIRYSGHVVPRDIINALKSFADEALEHAQQPHFFDLSGVTSFDIDYPSFFELVGNLIDVYPHSAGEHLCVFYAPPGIPAQIAEVLRKPFDGSDILLIRQAQTLEQAFDILGSERADLLKQLNAYA